MAKTKDRKKVNFMVQNGLISELEKLIPAGKRSDFVNKAIQRALTRYARKTALENVQEFRENSKTRITDKEITDLKNYGRQ